MENEQGTESAARATYPVIPSGASPSLPDSVTEILFEIAVAVMWSDGILGDAEVRRARALARALAVVPRRGPVFAVIANGPLPFSELAFDSLDEDDRRRAYAIAEWLAPTEPPTPRRANFLEALRIRLGLTTQEAIELKGLARATGALPAAEVSAIQQLLQALEPADVAAAE